MQRELLGWLLTYPFNLTATPAVTVPAGPAPDGLPVGLQIAGGHLGDTAVITAAAAFETIRPWRRRRPPAPAAPCG